MHPVELIGQILDEKYLIESQLGQGGMGAVYVATHLGTKRPVAVKIITPQFMAHTEFVERFRREAEAAGRLCHPNVVNVTDFGFAILGKDRIAYLVMEYLRGCTLGAVLREESKLRLEFVIDIVEQICAAIEEAHQQGIIHRDLKPDNIWLEPNGRGSYTVKVLDFGLAKLDNNPSFLVSNQDLIPTNTKSSGDSFPINISNPSLATAVQLPKSLTQDVSQTTEAITNIQPLKKADFQESDTHLQITNQINNDDEPATQIQLSDNKQTAQNHHITNSETAKVTGPLTQIGAILGTPQYMSPEQCRGEDLDARSDIYSLGIMTYEMLAGETPFTGNFNALLAQHLNTPPPNLREKRPDINKHINLLIMSMIAKKPEDRPANAAALARSLHARSETTLTLLRQALTFYTEHFPTIIRLSLLSHSFAIVAGVLLGISAATSEGSSYARFTNGHLDTNIQSSVQLAAVFINTFLLLFGYMVANVINLIVITPTLAQLSLFPVRFAKINIIKTLKKHLKSVLVTIPQLYGRVFLGSLLFVIPGIILTLRYLLTYPVIVIEGLKGKAALERSKELTGRIKMKVFFTWILMFIIPFASNAILDPYIKMLTKIKVSSLFLDGLINIFAISLKLLPNILINPIIFLMMSLLYFQACKYKGESLSESFLKQLEEENTPTKWQQQMQQQVRSRTRTTATTPTKSII